MKKIIFLFSVLLVCQPAVADVYPGDNAYTNIVQRVYHEVSSDSISMSYMSSIVTRNQLCTNLVSRHNSHTAPGASESNATYIGVQLTESDCLNALWYSDGYNSSAGWTAWSGNLTGTWFNDDNQQFTDPANWLAPVREVGIDNRTYDLQAVQFTSRTGGSRDGWNMSHPDVAYVWGWDAKNNGNQGGETGTHVGWAFDKSEAKCIVWATPEEAFLECVRPTNSCGGKKRVSTGFFGMGQWTIGLQNCIASRNLRLEKPFNLEKIKKLNKFIIKKNNVGNFSKK